MDSNNQTSTIRVPKDTLESIKIYCRRRGQSVGDFVESAWIFIKNNEFDIFKKDIKPSFSISDCLRQYNQIENLCCLINELIQTIVYLPQENEKIEYLKNENIRLKEENDKLQKEKDEQDEYLKNIPESMYNLKLELETAQRIIEEQKKELAQSALEISMANESKTKTEEELNLIREKLEELNIDKADYDKLKLNLKLAINELERCASSWFSKPYKGIIESLKE